MILAGNSAGGMIAVQYAFANQKELLNLIGAGDRNDNNTLDTLNAVSAVINFWGAIFDKEWLAKGETPL